MYTALISRAVLRRRHVKEVDEADAQELEAARQHSRGHQPIRLLLALLLPPSPCPACLAPSRCLLVPSLARVR